MDTLVSLAKITKKIKHMPFLHEVSMVVNEKGSPVGFVFGRDAFLDLLGHLDTEFQEKVSDQKKAYNNSAGQLIDAIEETLEIKPEFIKTLKASRLEAKNEKWISLDEIKRLLHV